ncbi:MAG TPA: hypothetical protein VM282_23645 [Acidimicrobiales bacterium]|nr:hypothetical protein [Acidimicrobiales bacterium]
MGIIVLVISILSGGGDGTRDSRRKMLAASRPIDLFAFLPVGSSRTP